MVRLTKQEFRLLFENALEVALQNADVKLGRRIPRTMQILLHGAGYSGAMFDVTKATDILYLGENLFYTCIDVAVLEVRKEVTVLFVRASGHTPTIFERTWNNPPGSGPFKQLVAQTIKVSDGE